MKKVLLFALILFGSAGFLFQSIALAAPVPVPVPSQCAGGFSAAQCSACSGISELGSSQDCASGGSGVTNIISVGVNILSYIIGIIAIVMVIISGIRFATSGGNSSSVESAKKTLIYAILGLVLAALAQVIVHWVLNSASNISTSGSLAQVLPLL